MPSGHQISHFKSQYYDGDDEIHAKNYERAFSENDSF
jgi:hypothetical protein